MRRLCHDPGSDDAAVRRSQTAHGAAWVLRTRKTSMVLHLDRAGRLYISHWGATGGPSPAEEYLWWSLARPASDAEFLDGQPLAFPVYGDPTYVEPCLVIARGDGGRDSRFAFVEDRVRASDGQTTLELDFRDPLLGLRLTQRFRALREHDLIVRSVAIANDGPAPVSVERLLTGTLPLPPDTYEAWTLHGRWGGEFRLRRRPLAPGKLVVESRRGMSSHEAHPWFAITPAGETTEHVGRAWVGALAWSGNWTAVVEVERNDALMIAVGLHPFDFTRRLEAGASFEAPELICGYSEEGIGGASRLLHRYEEEVALPAAQRATARPVLYNSWEATQFDVSVEQQMQLARRAAGLGVELFVVDDGWFGARDGDRAGLGDWTPNARKFPDGLGPLIDEVHRLGMRFGIWVEPEMVNPDSDLYRAHPDWAYHVAGRAPTLGRNQLVLNIARDDVREHILGRLRSLLADHGTVDFIKWDHNRPWTEVGWPERPDAQREVWARHVEGLYDMLRRLRAEFPHLLIETCASGGGRADLGMLSLADQAWTSDNTDAADRLVIQYGYSRAHSPRTMVNWVTDVPNQQTGRVAPLDFRFHVAMQGVLGIGGDIGRWSDEELGAAKQHIALYKAIRPIVQQGRQYWLLQPAPVGPCAVQYVSAGQDASVLFLYRARGETGKGAPRARLRGLLPERRYRREHDGVESTGAALMAAGVPVGLVDAPAASPGLDWRSHVQVWRAVDG